MKRTTAISQLQEIPPAPGALARAHEQGTRMPDLIDATRDLSASFREIDLVCVGVGSVGLPIALAGAQVGVRSLLLIDRGYFKRASLATHSGLSPADVGRSKAEFAGERAKALSPKTRVTVFHGDIADLPIHALGAATIVVNASDNLLCEVIVAQRALQLGLRVLTGSVYGRSLNAQVRNVWGGPDGEGPCLACFLGPVEWAQLDAGTVFSCSGEDAGRAKPAAQTTVSPPHLTSLAASLAFGELTRHVAGIGTQGNGSILDYSGYRNELRTSPLSRNAGCHLDHSCDRRAPVDAALAERTPREFMRAAGAAVADLRRVSLRVDGFQFASLAACACAPHPRLERFLPHAGVSGGACGASVGAVDCPDCGQVVFPHPMHVFNEVPMSLLTNVLDLPLCALGATSASSVRVRTDLGATLFLRPFPHSMEVTR